MNKVHVLFEGYSRADPAEPGCMRANCTCTLIRCATGRNIIVDTMTAWDGDRIVAALATLGVEPGDIYAVVCTHGHSDHIGCNYLFPEARYHFVGACVSRRDQYFEWQSEGEKEFRLDGDSVIVTPTPGHTLACVSVVVRNTEHGVVGICGDLFERVDDIENPAVWLEAGSENEREQRRQRLRMLEMCAYIIPGHGGGFAVSEAMRLTAREQIEQDVRGARGP